MILRISNTATRGAIVAIALVTLLWLSFYGIRAARATHYRESGRASGIERAAKLEPENARNWYFLGLSRQYDLEQQDSPGAIAAYNRALSIYGNSADTLMELGTAYELHGDFAAARAAFTKAKAVYPASADVSWRYGNFLLRQGNLPEAYIEIRRAVLADPNRAPEAFSRCYRANRDEDLILNEVLPPSTTGYVEVIRDIADTQTEIAVKVWKRLAALQPRLVVRDVYPLVNALLQKHDYAQARRVWDEGVNFTDAQPAASDNGAALWDGGFESGLNGYDFAWHFDAMRDGVQTSFDSREKHSGARSLRLDFGGKRNVQLENPCTIAVVEPRETYLLSGWIKTDKLTSEEGVKLRISADGSELSKTQAVLGSTPWSEVQTKWTAGSGARIAQVCVSREPSERTEGRIRGTAWVDDVALTRVAQGRPKQ
ncbi:MAG TPA: tetratricopeptide repeat protein [Candidatus Dormibacteraeota bacterium]|nr:tetratricopeptide repeat protein [Candidatus Dormibacteraeota bacterium]